MNTTDNNTTRTVADVVTDILPTITEKLKSAGARGIGFDNLMRWVSDETLWAYKGTALTALTNVTLTRLKAEKLVNTWTQGSRSNAEMRIAFRK